jgi:hypothetical protein
MKSVSPLTFLEMNGAAPALPCRPCRPDSAYSSTSCRALLGAPLAAFLACSIASTWWACAKVTPSRDAELRLLAAVRRSIREQGCAPSSRHVDELLDERLAHRGRAGQDAAVGTHRRPLYHCAPAFTKHSRCLTTLLRLQALYPDSAGRRRPELGLGRMMWASAVTKCSWSKRCQETAL